MFPCFPKPSLQHPEDHKCLAVSLRMDNSLYQPRYFHYGAAMVVPH
jgi:hypothetical protein